jgi:protocatechuate 3,4-dioxygenase beta subunit
MASVRRPPHLSVSQPVWDDTSTNSDERHRGPRRCYRSFVIVARMFHRTTAYGLGITVATILAVAALPAQSVHEAPADAPATGRVAAKGEPGQPLHVSGVVVDAKGAPIRRASLYVYQTDHEGYYGVKPASDNRNPRLKLFLRADERGAWSFDTVKPGSYPNSRVPPHVHFEVTAPGHAPKIFEIVFAGDPFVSEEMRDNPAFSIRPIERGSVTERIVMH